MCSNSYKIIKVCIPHDFFSIQNVFSRLQLCECVFIPKTHVSIYLLINKDKNEVEDVSSTYQDSFSLLNKKNIEKEEIKNDKELMKYRLSIKNTNKEKEKEKEKEKLDVNNYNLICECNDHDYKYIEEINKTLIDTIIKYMEDLNVINQKNILENSLNTQETQYPQKKLSK
ncbi:hypothetical protein [Pectobacterium jejuense]|uniref:hypothetical protein n=1 Tax=Pectobacterium jejuense TaxID=2974022 RepID=UPI002281DD3D|nr:hypothetical protein [Pectobacterium jejuense]MCY9846728.1 hypothetical protein [Pectobacterium jejuense]